MTTAEIRTWSIVDSCPASPDGRCDLTETGPFPDPTGVVGPMTVHRCRRCGCGVTRPALPDVAPLYADRTSRDFQGDTAGLSHWIKRIAFRRQARTLLRQLGGAPRRIVDFGCGSGLLTACIAEMAPETEVIGADFHPQAPRDLAGRAYLPMAELGSLAGAADAVVAMHVLEHDDDPMKLLRRMAAPLRPGGRMLIEVPNIDCIWVPVFGKRWEGWYLPFHRVHFSRAALRALMQHAGLRIVGEYDVSTPAMGRNLAQALGLRNSTVFILLTAALQPLQWLLEGLTGRPSALRVVVELPAP